MLGIFSAMEVAASGLTAERARMNTIASNLANARTTRTRARRPVQAPRPDLRGPAGSTRTAKSRPPSGVSLVKSRASEQDQRPGTMVYEPGHPDANAEGYVEYPNVNAVEEMVNMITASRAYEAGITSIDTVKRMARSALDIGR